MVGCMRGCRDASWWKDVSWEVGPHLLDGPGDGSDGADMLLGGQLDTPWTHLVDGSRIKDVSDGADTLLVVMGMHHRAGNTSGGMFPDGSPCLGAQMTLGMSRDMPFDVSRASFGRVNVSQWQ